MVPTIAAHIIFFWVLSLTVQSKTVDNINDKQKMEDSQNGTTQKQKNKK